MAAPVYNRSVGLSRARPNRRKPVNLNRGMANLAPYSRAPKGADQLPPLQVAKLTRRLVKAKQGFRSNADLPGSGLSASGPIQGSVSNNPYLSRIKTLRGRLAGQRPPGQKPEGPQPGGGSVYGRASRSVQGQNRQAPPGVPSSGFSGTVTPGGGTRDQGGNRQVAPGSAGYSRSRRRAFKPRGGFGSASYGRSRRPSRFRPPLS